MLKWSTLHAVSLAFFFVATAYWTLTSVYWAHALIIGRFFLCPWAWSNWCFTRRFNVCWCCKRVCVFLNASFFGVEWWLDSVLITWMRYIMSFNGYLVAFFPCWLIWIGVTLSWDYANMLFKFKLTSNALKLIFGTDSPWPHGFQRCLPSDYSEASDTETFIKLWGLYIQSDKGNRSRILTSGDIVNLVAVICCVCSPGVVVLA